MAELRTKITEFVKVDDMNRTVNQLRENTHLLQTRMNEKLAEKTEISKLEKILRTWCNQNFVIASYQKDTND